MSDNVSHDKEREILNSVLNSLRSINDLPKQLNEMKDLTSQQIVFDAVDQLTNKLLEMEDDFKLNSKAELEQSLKTLKATVPNAMDLHEQMSKKADELKMKCDQWIRQMIKDGTKDISTSDFKSFLQTLEEISTVYEPYFKCNKQLQNQLTEVKDISDKFFAEMQQEMKKKEEEFKIKEAAAYEADCGRKANEENRLQDQIWAFAIGFGVLAAACIGCGLLSLGAAGGMARIAGAAGIAGVAGIAAGGVARHLASETMSSADFMSKVIDKIDTDYNVVKTLQQQIDKLEMQMEGFRCHFNELNELLDKCEANSQVDEITQEMMRTVINEIRHEIQRREEEQRKDEENRALKEELRLKDEKLRLKDEENRLKDEENRLKDEEILRLKAELAAEQH